MWISSAEYTELFLVMVHVDPAVVSWKTRFLPFPPHLFSLYLFPTSISFLGLCLKFFILHSAENIRKLTSFYPLTKINIVHVIIYYTWRTLY